MATRIFGPSVHVTIREAFNFAHGYSISEVNEALSAACDDEGVKNLKNLGKERKDAVIASAAEILVETHGVRLK